MMVVRCTVIMVVRMTLTVLVFYSIFITLVSIQRSFGDVLYWTRSHYLAEVKVIFWYVICVVMLVSGVAVMHMV